MSKEPLLHRYQPVSGVPELLEALKEKLRRQNRIALNEDVDLMVTAGANAAFLQTILAICDPGDEVVLPLPYYFNQEMALRLANVRPVLIPTDARYHPDPDIIGSAINKHTRAIVTISPNNPTGAVYPEALLQAIQSLCRSHRIYHISDETYECFTYDGRRHVSPASFANAAPQTISLFSFSKAYGFASWRVGYMVFPTTLREALRKIQDTNLICPPVSSQIAAAGCLRAEESWLATRIAEMAEVRRQVLQGLASIARYAQVSEAEGAFYVGMRLDTPMDSLEIVRRLISEHRVALIPGSAFGVTEECFLRLAYGALTRGQVEEAITRLAFGLRMILRN